MTSTKMWSNAGIAGTLAAYAAAGRAELRVSRSVDTNVHTLAGCAHREHNARLAVSGTRGGLRQDFIRSRGIMTLASGTLTDDVTAAPAAHATDLRKTYGTGQAAVHARAGITVTSERGRFTAVMGTSGSGKATLMNGM